MKPETLERLRYHLATLSDNSLTDFFVALLDELRKRNELSRHPEEPMGFWELKDCNPNPGD